ncbi:hypothetical protein PL373_04100 [Tenacibaculum maritimum]|nr:hypothetical protein [Tenacibaculum maritimum]
MALPISGQISFRMILAEMGQSQTITTNIDSLASQWYSKTGKSKFNSLTHRLSDWYGETWLTIIKPDPIDFI